MLKKENKYISKNTNDVVVMSCVFDKKYMK